MDRNINEIILLPCDTCRTETEHEYSRYCGVWQCCECEDHEHLDRCYCGWARSGGNGRTELEEFGEQIEEI